MSYPGNDIGSLRFLGANVIYQTTVAMLRPDTGDEADRGVLDDAVMLMDVIGSYHTEADDAYAHEMAAIRRDREKAQSQVPRGMELDGSTQEAFRWRELKAMFRALCRAGAFVRQASPEAEWNPAARP